jgi:hypothetical protein
VVRMLVAGPKVSAVWVVMRRVQAAEPLLRQQHAAQKQISTAWSVSYKGTIVLRFSECRWAAKCVWYDHFCCSSGN